MTELSAVSYKEHGRYYVTSDDKQWCVTVRSTTGKVVSALFDEEPEIDGEPPSEVVRMIKSRIKEFLFISDREKKLAAIQWFEDNEKQIDSGWARKSIESLQKRIHDLQVYILEEEATGE